MDRRESLKSIVLGSLAGGLVLNGCKPGEEQELAEAIEQKAGDYYGRTPEELERDKELMEEELLTEHERELLTVLCDVILPPGDTYKGASDADVAGFIEFMAKDIPELQTPLRGGLLDLEHKCYQAFDKSFVNATEAEQKELIDPIAYYDPDVPELERDPAVNFFSLVRNLTLTGFYTSKIGIEELGYKGNSPNVWDGVPEEVLAQHGVSYDPEWVAKCIDQEKRNIQAEWDDKGNLIT
ncbi:MULTISPECIES: gluconate 2-dehydrogenase subunit 3 family protein [Robiginitalea]|uniref:gluconate 2-dehydrogenase subunit 3 family protein n=1 Tax=Robiginitalea TaxID=252306 RepID=UPI002348F553|nr:MULTISPECIES: gluconate 2-dehydrogenase subunit 3 family protein [unclassified Robiginitalea]MDC6355684.1 gluconate 2-dehydrogenase subunit 3 family protein [Robiginitalea sp. PM2]MDC6376113.1 gluconate 2-dehydrogenase subunit 3 family protein [Robiginitalea sp. SP8]